MCFPPSFFPVTCHSDAEICLNGALFVMFPRQWPFSTFTFTATEFALLMNYRQEFKFFWSTGISLEFPPICRWISRWKAWCPECQSTGTDKCPRHKHFICGFLQGREGTFVEALWVGRSTLPQGGPKPRRTDHRGLQGRGQPCDSHAMLSLWHTKPDDTAFCLAICLNFSFLKPKLFWKKGKEERGKRERGKKIGRSLYESDHKPFTWVLLVLVHGLMSTEQKEIKCPHVIFYDY